MITVFSLLLFPEHQSILYFLHKFHLHKIYQGRVVQICVSVLVELQNQTAERKPKCGQLLNCIHLYILGLAK